VVISKHFEDFREMNFLEVNFIKSRIFFIVSVTRVCILFKDHLENFTIFADKVLNFYLINIFLKCKIHNFNRSKRLFIGLSWNVSKSTYVQIPVTFSFLNTKLNSSLFYLLCYFLFISLFFQFLFLLFYELLVF